MESGSASRPRAPHFIDPPGYARHRPEATLLYRLIERHYPEFVAAREAAGRPLPKYVREEFEAYLDPPAALTHWPLRAPLPAEQGGASKRPSATSGLAHSASEFQEQRGVLRH